MDRTNILVKQMGIVGTVQGAQATCQNNQINIRRLTMWTKPEVTEMRFGFEVTMYVCNR